MTVGHEIVGTGPERVIAMHNWMGTLRSYEGLWPFLDSETFTYAFMDHRGYGLSRDIAGEHTAKEAAGDTLALADSLGWDRFHVMGHSMSGMVAQRVTLDARERVKSMVAVTPVPATGVPIDAEGEALFKGAATDDEKWKTISHMLTGNRLSENWHDMALRHCRANVDSDAFLDFLRMWTETDFSDEMRDLEMPTLVIVGAHDFEAFSEDAMRNTLGSWYKSATIEVLQGTGHHPMAEVPVYFATVVENFLRSAAGR